MLTLVTRTPARSTTSETEVRGLTSAQVAERIARGETNAFKARVGRSYWDIVRDNVLNLFNIVLFSLLMVVLWFGDYGTVFFAGFSVVTNSFLGMLQEISAKRKLDQLAALSEPEVRVWRDGQLTTVNMHDVVKDDVIPLEPGDKVVVDGSVIESDSLEMDESQLTGESDAVLKDAGDGVSSGSFCIAGSGTMVATVVGRNSTINKLSTVAKAYKNVLTPTQQRISLIVQISVVIMAVCTPMIFIAGYLNLGGIFNLNTFRNAVVFVTSIVPQGLVLTAILSLTIGAITISRRQTLVQRVNAVESMANVNVFCFDKTGTLTKNQLTVSDIIPLGTADSAQAKGALQRYLTNLSHLNRTAAAVAEYLNAAPSGGSTTTAKLREVPFTSARKWGAVILPDETLIMGAPERVLPEGHPAILQAETLATEGLRVLGFARSSSPMSDGVLEAREPVALIVLSDQVRENIRETLNAFADVGVVLKVISGDNLETVRQIAQEAGMTIRKAYTGAQIEQMDETELAGAVADGDLFARIEPDTKRRIVSALKRQGYYVGMTGDGVNDVPALKEAHLAVVMNDGAQISKDVADIVLLNNALTTMPEAFREGRIITQTIFGTSKIFLVKNLYSLLFFIFAGFMLMPFPINPIQISWMTFGVINIPATLIAFRILRPDYMQRFRRDVLDYVFTAGFIGSVAMALLYAITYLGNSRDVLEARSTIMLFMAMWGALVFLNTHGVNPYSPRTFAGRGRITLIGIALLVGTIAVPYIEPARTILEYVPPSNADWGFTLIIFIVASITLHFGMKSRLLVNRIWGLTAPP